MLKVGSQQGELVPIARQFTANIDTPHRMAIVKRAASSSDRSSYYIDRILNEINCVDPKDSRT